MLNVYHSNRLERLLDQLLEIISIPLSEPLASEVIVVQNQGMARWLSLRLAEHHSVAANLEFPLPASFIWSVFASQFEAVPQTSGFTKEILTWRILALLLHWVDQPGFEPLRQYLQRNPSEVKPYQLASRIAQVFDQYLVYRPEWIRQWEQGEESHWQAQLWRALLAQSRGPHRVHYLLEFIERSQDGRLDPQRLPERILVFGVSALAPAYLDVLARIATVTEVHLFFLNPCLAYWGDIVDERDLARLRVLWRQHGQPDVGEYFTVGNPLLASMGKLGRDFVEQLHQYSCRDHEAFEIPRSPHLLADLQRDILLLWNRGEGTAQPAIVLADRDRSVQVHSCHSPLREIQVLHDQLLALFETLTDLRPQDIIVMAPEMDVYAPYVEAVFGAAPARRQIPWSIADRSEQAEHPILSAVLALLDLPAQRFTVSEVLALLEVPAILRRFGLDATGLERLRTWVSESGIRWGTDAAARTALGLPAGDENTWAFGLRRMFLGYAMPPGAASYHGVIPYEAIEGSEAPTMGQLAAFIAALEDWQRRLQLPYRAQEWWQLGNELLGTFFLPEPEESWALQAVRDAFDALAEQMTEAEFAEAIPLEIVREHLVGCLSEPSRFQPFLGGQVTFCNMVPMRNIPFRVVCLVGMNDPDYPRERTALGFDLMARYPRKGDRSRREDDRYLFLEALLSAREVFYVSYVGASVRDNSVRLPSVLVNELLEHVDQAFRSPRGSAREHVLVHHPLQPFSHRYFQRDDRIFTYADEWLAGARHLGNRRCEQASFVEQSLGEPEPSYREVELESLIRFFRNPARFFLNQRLGVWLGEATQLPEDSESFTLDHLTHYQIGQQILIQALRNPAAPLDYPTLRALGVLPHGSFGKLAYERVVARIPAMVQELAPRLAAECDPVEVDLALGAFQVRGWLRPMTPEGLLSYRYGKLQPGDWLSLWIQHLALNVVCPSGCLLESKHRAAEESLRLGPVQEARHYLQGLLNAYWRGLCRPLRFFPKSSFAYAKAITKNGDAQGACRLARQQWEPGYYQEGEGDSPYYQTAFRGSAALDEEFAILADSMFRPIFEHQIPED